MLIRYKPKVDHVKCIPLIPDPKDPKSYDRNQIMLIPGTNEITDDEWAAIKSLVATEIKLGEISVMNVESKKSKDGKARSLKEVPFSIARDIIAKCNNPATLKKWYKEETRDEVLLAVTKQMRKVKLDPDDIEKEIEKEKKDKPEDEITDPDLDTGSDDPEGGSGDEIPDFDQNDDEKDEDD